GRLQRPLDLDGQLLADEDVLPVARLGPAPGLGLVGAVDRRELLRRVGLGRLALLSAPARGLPLGVDPGAAAYGDQLLALILVAEVVGDVGGPAAEVAALGDHADLRPELLQAVAEPERPPPLVLHHRLVGAEAGERVATEQRLLLRGRWRGGVLAHRVEEG